MSGRPIDTEGSSAIAKWLGTRGPSIFANSVPGRNAVLANLVGISTFTALGMSLGVVNYSILGLAIGVGLAIAIAVISLTHLIRALVGGLLLLVALGAAFGAPLLMQVTAGGYAAGVIGLGVLVGFGLAQFHLAAYGDGAIAEAMAWVARVAIVIGATMLVFLPVTAEMPKLISMTGAVLPLELLVTPPSMSAAVGGFIAICWLAFAGIWIASTAIPLSSMFADERRQRFDSFRSRVLTGAGILLGGGSVVVGLVYGVSAEANTIAGIAVVVTGLVESSALRIGLLRVFVGGIGIAIGVSAIRRVSAIAVGTRPAWLPSALVVTAAVFGAGIFVGEPFIRTVEAFTGGVIPLTTVASVFHPTVPVLGLAFIGFLGVMGLLAIFPIFTALGILPARTAGPRLALVGTIGAAVLVAHASGPPVVVFAGILGGIITWDIGDYGAGLKADIREDSHRHRGAIVHAASSFLVGVGALVGALAINWLLAGAANSLSGSLLSAIVSIVALGILVMLLR